MKIAGMALGGALLIGLTIATPADGQGRGNDRDRREAVQDSRGRDRGDMVRRSRGNGSGKVPPGWCRGVGNPHNTPENCGYDRRRDRYDDDDRWDDSDYSDRDGGRSYQRSHEQFHRELDDRYARLSAQRPLDVVYQVELRVRKNAEHDEWHRRQGVAH